MPDGPRCDDDFYAWTHYQAEVLRSLPTSDNRFDRDHVAEEIADLGKSERDAVCSEVRRILEHFLKLAYSPTVGPRSDWPRSDWIVSIANARAELEQKLSATLQRDAEAELPRLYVRAKRVAQAGLVKYGEAYLAAKFPASYPDTLEQILDNDWYPEPAGESR